MANLILNKFIVDGIHWDKVPGEFAPAYDTHGVRVVSFAQLDLSRIIVTEAATPNTTSPGIENRRIHRQAWVAGWTEESPMDLCMRDFLYNLYYIQKGFWIQFDNEMSRRDVQLMDLDGLGKVFFTPTYPIAPYGYTSANPIGYKGLVRKNNGTWIVNFKVDSEIGKVEILNTDASYPITYPNYPVMDYTWKAFVRIAAINLHPIEITRNYYQGEIMFEQITPNYAYDPWQINYHCSPFSPASGGGTGTVPSVAPSIPSGGTLGVTDGVGTVSPTSPPINTEGVNATNENQLTFFVSTLATGQSTDPSFGFGSGGTLIDSRVTEPGLTMGLPTDAVIE